jgi:hypothetical protein
LYLCSTDGRITKELSIQGHLEGDIIKGEGNASAVGKERTSR